jgi:phospholipid transport system substrate-binding protein
MKPIIRNLSWLKWGVMKGIFITVFLGCVGISVTMGSELAVNEKPSATLQRNTIEFLDTHVKKESAKLIAVLMDDSVSENVKVDTVVEMSNTLIDFELITKLCVGRRNWRKLNNSQILNLTAVFKRHLQVFYTDLLIKNISQNIKYFPTEINENRGIVSFVVDDKFRLAYKFRWNQNEWKIYDLEFQGVSMLSTYRVQFDLFLNPFNQINYSDFDVLGDARPDVYKQLIDNQLIRQDTASVVTVIPDDMAMVDRLDFLTPSDKKLVMQIMKRSEVYYDQLIQSIK